MNTHQGLAKANFAGPSTHLQERLARGDRGINQIDEAARLHDIAYSEAKTEQDIRKADNDMIKRVKAATDSSNTQKNIVIAALKAKKFGEDVGVFNVDTFTKLKGLRGSGVMEENELDGLINRIKPNAKQILQSQALKQSHKKARKKSKKRKTKQKGEGFGLIAGLLGSLIIPKIVKGVKKIIG